MRCRCDVGLASPSDRDGGSVCGMPYPTAITIVIVVLLILILLAVTGHLAL